MFRSQISNISYSLGSSAYLVLSRFTRNEFNFNYNATVGVDFGWRTLTIGGKVLKAQIWDTGKSCDTRPPAHLT